MQRMKEGTQQVAVLDEISLLVFCTLILVIVIIVWFAYEIWRAPLVEDKIDKNQKDE